MISQPITTIDTAFKDDTPQNTVARIKGILDHYGIQTTEFWFDSGVPGCHSVRVTVTGTVFGTNGKGVTRELALASGYGELMERLQIGRIFKGDRQKVGDISSKKSEAQVNAESLLNKNMAWYTRLSEDARQITGVTISPEELLRQYTDQNGNVAVTSYYCINSGTREYLPTELLKIYGTNGCAAGNTTEEVLVQAISEIVERRFSSRILTEQIDVPDIPEEVLRSYPHAYSVITFLRQRNFKVVVKDCSLGTKFPVICVCLVDLKTGKYHTHFGAYPIFEIALNRTLTESFQGRNIQKIAQFEKFFTQKGDSLDLGNLLNQMCKGASEKSPYFFISSTAPAAISCGFTGTNNRQLLAECVEFLQEQGCDILVRDYSCLGFPTYQVVIPGYSETFVHRLIPDFNDVRYSSYAQLVLRNPAAAKHNELVGFQMHLVQSAKQKMKAPSFSAQANLPLEMENGEEGYLMDASMAYINYALGRHGECVKYISKMLLRREDHQATLLCLKRYLNLMAEHYRPEQIREILTYFHEEETVQALMDIIDKQENPLDGFVLHCDLACQPTCKLYGKCLKKQTDALSRMIEGKQLKVDQAILQQALASMR